jgi:hypothetical protein
MLRRICPHDKAIYPPIEERLEMFNANMFVEHIHNGATMSLMKYFALISLSAIGIFCGACASPRPASGTIATEITRDVAEGTWALTDSENGLFNVNLLNDGVAISNWCKGADGAKGEHGTWKIDEGVLVMNWTDGWLDVIQLGHIGFEKYSYAPRVNRQGPPTSFGQAVKVLNYSAQWAGVWKTRSADPAYNNQSFYICLQSNGAAMKSIDAISTGCWQKQQDGIAIYFSDGWYMMLVRDGDNVQATSWAPGVARTAAPTGTCPIAQVLE